MFRTLPKLIVITSALLIISLSLRIAMAQESDDACTEKQIVQDNGRCWNTLQNFQKSFIIRGMWAGKRIAWATARLEGNQPVNLLQIDYSFVPTDTSIGDIQGYFDELYATPANRRIDWADAYILAAQKMRDDDSNDRLSMIRFLRDHGEIPVNGVWVASKSPSTLVIRVEDGRDIDIKLAGLALDEAHFDKQSKLVRFLDAMRQANYFPCSQFSSLPVKLLYRDELFDSEGNLSAYLQLPYFAGVCKHGKELKLGQVFNASSDIDLNYFLVRSGLASVNRQVDPQWSEERRRIRQFMISSADNLKSSGLNSYLLEAQAQVEQVLNQ